MIKANMINKRSLARRIWPRHINTVDLINTLPLFEQFRDQNKSTSLYSDRFSMWSEINNRLGNIPIDYLEFGVFEGESIRAWSKLNSNPASRFVGFDCFEGLPEDFRKQYPKGSFDMQGHVPLVDDIRVRFVKGYFQDTLPSFLANFSSERALVINNDSDLYSSTLYALAMLDRFIKPGAIVIFDEFGDLLNEFRAFNDYSRSFLRRTHVIASTGNWWQVAFQFL
jgi:O-methyltransferase